MKLWIRSQDKERLCKSNNLFIKNLAICCSYNEENNDFDYLGVYKTKERALEVLDEIQNKLLKSKYDKAMENYGKHSDCKDTLIEISSSTYVYEMPKE